MNEYTYKLTIIIVSYNVKGLLIRCLESISENIPNFKLQTIVVDNASTDGSAEELTKRNDIELIFSNKNLGFAGANNLALSQAKGEIVLFLNPDTEIIDGSLKAMADYLDEHKDTDGLGPKLLNSDKTLQFSVRSFPNLISQILILLKLQNFFSFLPPLRKYYKLDFNYEKSSEVQQVMGAALMVRKKILDKIGGFDPAYCRIFEEVDLCKRISLAGYKLTYFPGAQIIHHKGASFHGAKFKPSLKRQIYFNHDMIYYFKKHKPAWQAQVLGLVRPFSLLLTAISMIIFAFFPQAGKLKNRDL